MAVPYDSHERIGQSDKYDADDVPDELVESLIRRVTVFECPECGEPEFLWAKSGRNTPVECDECGYSGSIP